MEISTHMLIDSYTRWPEVDMTMSTSMSKLYKVLDKTMVMHGVPETITSDNGPPYNSRVEAVWQGVWF